MFHAAISSLAFSIPLLALMQMPGRGRSMGLGFQNSPHGVRIGTQHVTVDAMCLKMEYKIQNTSENDIWICDSMDLHSRWGDCEVYIGEDNQTLFIQRRLDVAMQGLRSQPVGRYVRLPRGRTRTEVVLMSLPVHQRGVLFGIRGAQPAEQASRVVIEIGYYEGDLPERISQMLEDRGDVSPKGSTKVPEYAPGLIGMLGGPLFFNSINECVRDRNEQVIVPWTDRAIEGERVLRMIVDNLAIPYSEERLKPTPIHLSPLRCIDVRLRTPGLEFFFPHPQEQSLFSPGERQYVQSLKHFAVEDRWNLMGIAYDLSEATDSVFLTNRAVADLTCHRGDGTTVSLTVYDDMYIGTPGGQVFRCLDGVTRLRMFSPQLQSFDRRARCGMNLKNLWYRFRRYYVSQRSLHEPGGTLGTNQNGGRSLTPEMSDGRERAYPPAADWCDALLRGYPSRMTILQCPGGAEGECHYAVNVNCRPESAQSMVLLFETKAGWNQHGGPELFTSDNHDPKGGLVLLNDGTVKFIRTEEELKQLRWK